MQRSYLVLLSGLPGTGKTTFAIRLAAAIAAVHLESDAVRRELVASPTHAAAESVRVFGVIRERAEAALLDGNPVIIDATNLGEDDRAPFLALAARLGIRCCAVRMVAHDAIVRERLASSREGASNAGLEVYERMQPREVLHREPHLVVDSSHDIEPALALVRTLMGTR